MANVWRKVYPRFWRDEGIRQLDPLGKLVVLYLMTAQANRVGIFSFSLALAAEEIGVSMRAFRKRFDTICERLSWKYDEEARVLYIPTWWKYNPPDHGNVLKGNLADLDELPATSLLFEFYNNTQYLNGSKEKDLVGVFRQTLMEAYPQGHPQAYPQGHPEGSPQGHPQPPPVQEQDQKQDQDQEHHQARARGDDGVQSKIPNSLSEEEIRWDAEKAWQGISPETRKIWRKAYPDCDVGQQLREMNAWLLVHPGKAKRKEWGPFIVNWLSRQEEKVRKSER